jgi:DNA (cytosine-5)-methyltransferase 1
VHSLTSEGHDASEDGTGRGTPVVAYKGEPDEHSGDHRAELRRNDIAVQPLAIRGREGGAKLEAGEVGAPYNALRAGDGGSSRQSLIAVNRHAETIVRRLTELECERLQGYPDGWTEGQTASARYRQLGNSVAVPCVEWIARRLIEVDRGN